MKRYMAALAIALGLGAGPAQAAQRSEMPSTEPARLTDGELDGVVAGDPLILVNVAVAAPVSVHIDPITVSVPVNVAAIVQANVLGNGVFDAIAVGTQNVFNATAALPTR